jgi:hypothetical protein
MSIETIFQNAESFRTAMSPGVYYIPLALMVVGFLLPIFLVARTFLGWRRNRRLLRTGAPAQAKILKIWDTGVSVNDNPQVGMLLAVYPEDGMPYQAETRSIVSRLHIPLVQVGLSVEVRFDPLDPSKVALVM